MTDLAIKVDGLSKRYQLGEAQGPYATLRDQVHRWASAPLRALRRRGGRSNPRTSFWALKDVSFEVARGEVLGIIGRNGAGKSTLLKILSRVAEPTEGSADIYGRVGSLLEVGTGFHPELTGRENVYLNGAILGMRRSEIGRKFDDIVSFAEVEKFIDTPVKHFSSGMYMRLAFAVAAHLDPEILIIDEVLAVGDANFQKRCLGKIGEVAQGGRTVLFVSHNMAAVQSLCRTVAFLEDGTVAAIGSSTEVIHRYLSEKENLWTGDRGSVRLGPDLEVLDIGFRPGLFAEEGSATFRVHLRTSANVAIEGLCGLVYSALDTRVAIIDLRVESGFPRLQAGQELIVEVQAEDINMVEGQYKLGLYVHTNEINGDFLDLTAFEVSPGKPRTGVIPYAPVHRGFVKLKLGRPKLTTI
jgi:lipopolysaccharide transport system ATP-binding protein